MNRGVFVACVALAALLYVEAAPAETTFTDKYDNVDLDEILSNERLLKSYVNCLLSDSDGKCTADGKELRKAIPDALTNDCAKCTAKQRSGAEKVIKHLREHKAADWQKLQAKWDPEGVYVKKYADKLTA